MKFDDHSLAAARQLLRTYIAQWKLFVEDEPLQTNVCLLQPVCYEHRPAMLKVSVNEEEINGGRLMSFWKGRGMAAVYRQDGPAVLLERGGRADELDSMAHGGADSEANRIMCGVLARLHETKPGAASDFVPLDQWFSELRTAAATHGGVLDACLKVAEMRLSNQHRITCLHGDMHHRNVLWFEGAGWKAIDPKCLVGERYFDYANLLTNPESELAVAPGRLEEQLSVICAEARLEERRMLEWTAAWAGLSAAWYINAGEDGSRELELAERAITLLELNF